MDSRYRRARSIGVPALALVLVAGCAHHPKPVAEPVAKPVSPPPAPPATVATNLLAQPGLTPSQRMERAIEMLQVGKPEIARPELVELLKDRPQDRHAGLLLQTIDTDPKQLYGGDSFAVEVRPGQTFFSLARQYLGDTLNFYGLARFNGIAVPSSLTPGQTIQIPGHPRSPAWPQRTRRPSAPRPEAAPAANGAAAVEHPAGDPRRAQALRARGLEQMSAGSIDRAVSLLSQAAVLAPDDAKIASDLARARRIQATVHSQ